MTTELMRLRAVTIEEQPVSVLPGDTLTLRLDDEVQTIDITAERIGLRTVLIGDDGKLRDEASEIIGTIRSTEADVSFTTTRETSQ